MTMDLIYRSAFSGTRGIVTSVAREYNQTHKVLPNIASEKRYYSMYHVYAQYSIQCGVSHPAF